VDVALSHIELDRSSQLQERKFSSKSNVRRSSPSFRVHMRTKSGRMSIASGAFSPPCLTEQNLIFKLAFPLHNTDSFLYDGTRINDDDTPASLDMEDNGMFTSIQSLVF